MSVGEMSVGEMSIGEVSVGEMSVGEMSWIRGERVHIKHTAHGPLTVMVPVVWPGTNQVWIVFCYPCLLKDRNTTPNKPFYIQSQLKMQEWKTCEIETFSDCIDASYIECKNANDSYRIYRKDSCTGKIAAGGIWASKSVLDQT